jgi:hypothetical protein
MKNNNLTAKLRVLTQPAFAVIYLLCCLIPVVSAGGTVFSVYGLPPINVVQVLVYPVCIALIFALGFLSAPIRDGESVFTAVISVANLIFLVLTPITLKNQVSRGWPGYWITADAIRMSAGYYLLYCLTVAYLAVFLIRLRLRAVKNAETE